ncbi:DNA repair exonuclease [Methylovirgula ligni]|uniref:DNA repair exonuclease SbcCD nuclease subunit n=1 Tax=Methylovirgula ligni TaxID=569860 RepID=A0A3D9Z310_9HYPH|nr:DNA repair exonuclease [Methylovirgula ligni]QAY95151.1 DNA repair exonuclease [Methylovirgula ligni]REF89564.1 DNA repair exonuclease SbcCD nuclease subunit [Methylovirgula ligni]
MVRFIHASDLHLGRRFGNMPEDLRGRLREARHTAIGKLAACARQHDAALVLLAGDTFDTETPTPAIRRQAIAEMGHSAPLRWVLLPGNHDSLQAAQLWNALRDELPPNVILATEPKGILVEPDALLLPAPCTTRRPGRDLTEWMSGAEASEGAIRIGLAHGAIQSFSEDAIAADIIPPDRAARSGLDYLALGDWHGTTEVNARTYYSGTPEPDRFKHDKPGQVLSVAISARGAPPEITVVQTGTFMWQTLAVRFLSQENSTATLAGLLPHGPQRRQTLLRILASGRTKLEERTALSASVEQVSPEFAYLELNDRDLSTDCEATDLDLIDRTGALREAANALMVESVDENSSASDREISQAALIRLFSYCQKVSR